MNMRKQRRMGAALVVLSWIMLLLALTGTSPAEQDVTTVLLFLPSGLYMIFTEQYILCP